MRGWEEFNATKPDNAINPDDNFNVAESIGLIDKEAANK